MLGHSAAWQSGALPAPPARAGSPWPCPDPHSWEATASAARSSPRELAALGFGMAPLRNLTAGGIPGLGVCLWRGQRANDGPERAERAGRLTQAPGCPGLLCVDRRGPACRRQGKVQTPERERVCQPRSLCAQCRGQGAEGVCMFEAPSDPVGWQALPGTRRPRRLGPGRWAHTTAPGRE